MPTIDEAMLLRDVDCPFCGLHKDYHNKSIMKDNVISCVRKKPFKLADKTDLKLGMQIWFYNQCHENDAIYTGMVRFISSWGYVTIWKYPEDRDPKKIFNIAYNNPYMAGRDCFSTLKGAEEFREKEIKAREELKAWMEKHK